MKYIAEVDGMEFPIEILDDHHIQFGNDVLEVDFTGVNGQPLYSMIVNGESFEGYVYPDDQKWQVLLLGRSYSVRVADEREKRLIVNETSSLQPGKEFVLKSPMPGLVVLIPVVESQEVRKGEILVILESMKMQNELRSPVDGQIARIRVKQGENVQQKQILLSLVSL